MAACALVRIAVPSGHTNLQLEALLETRAGVNGLIALGAGAVGRLGVLEDVGKLDAAVDNVHQLLLGGAAQLDPGGLELAAVLVRQLLHLQRVQGTCNSGGGGSSSAELSGAAANTAVESNWVGGMQLQAAP